MNSENKLPHEKTEAKVKEIVARNRKIRNSKESEFYNVIAQLRQLLNSHFPNKEV